MRLILFLFFPLLLIGQTETSTSLYFQNDVFTLNNVHLKKIDSLKKSIAKIDSVSIKIIGYANAYGTERYNLILSNKRAEAVQSLFSEYTILSVKGFGELTSIAAKNRRVDVFISSFKNLNVENENLEQSENKKRIEVNNLSVLKIGDKIALKGILFQAGSDVFLSESKIALQELYEYVNAHKDLRIKLIGHVCCPGNLNPKIDGVNKRTLKKTLSVDRARAVYTFLTNKGIINSRIKYEGRAALELTGKGSKYDRRVEIEILE